MVLSSVPTVYVDIFITKGKCFFVICLSFLPSRSTLGNIVFDFSAVTL